MNTHRGAIFAFGLLSAAAGRLVSKGEPIEQHRLCDQVARFCRGMVMQELSSAGGERLSKGEAHFLRYGLSGARGEAESGFPDGAYPGHASIYPHDGRDRRQ